MSEAPLYPHRRGIECPFESLSLSQAAVTANLLTRFGDALRHAEAAYALDPDDARHRLEVLSSVENAIAVCVCRVRCQGVLAG